MEFNSGVDAEGCFGEIYLDGYEHVSAPGSSLPGTAAEETTVAEEILDLNFSEPVGHHS